MLQLNQEHAAEAARIGYTRAVRCTSKCGEYEVVLWVKPGRDLTKDFTAVDAKSGTCCNVAGENWNCEEITE